MATGRGPGSAPCAHPGPRPPPHCPPRALVAAALGSLRGRFCRITGLLQNRPRFFYSPRKFCADRGFTPGAAALLFPFGRQRREHPRAFYVSRSAALASTPSIPPCSRVFDGCAAAGCCYGIPYDGIGAVVYTESLIAPEHVSLFPVQALEAVLNLMLAAALFLYVYKKKGKEL